MPSFEDEFPHERKERGAQKQRKDVGTQDARLDPDGVYSGMTKRLAISDGSFVDVRGASQDFRKLKRLGRENTALPDLSRGKFS